MVARFAERPRIVFVTAYDDHAVDAFELQAVDYVMKPVRADRIAEAVRRAVTAGSPDPAATDDETIAVELAGVTRFVRRSQVRYVEAQGDYARLHTASGSHLLRIPLAVLEERWAAAGFVRIHRSTLVALHHVEEVRLVDGRTHRARLGADELPVSRRHTPRTCATASSSVSGGGGGWRTGSGEQGRSSGYASPIRVPRRPARPVPPGVARDRRADRRWAESTCPRSSAASGGWP